MNPESLILPLLDLFFKSTAVFLLATLAVLLWRGASAAGRHMVWFAAFLLLLLLPFTELATPLWNFALPEKTSHIVPSRAAASSPEPDVQPIAGVAGQPGGQVWEPGWRYVAGAIWLTGALLLLAHRAAGSLQLRWLMKQSRGVDSERTLRMAREIAGANGIHVELRESAQARVPMTWGAFRSVILLPAGAGDWSDAQLRAALLHEAGHIRRHDYLLRFFAQIACALYWVNPLVWLAARELRLAQELACDDLVLSSGMDAGEYANQLIHAVRNLQPARSRAAQSLAMAHPSTLERRVRAIMEPQRNRQPSGRGATAISITAATAALFISALAQIGAADSPTPAPGNTDKRATIDALAEKIRTALPVGWKATYDAKRAALIIERNDPVIENESDMPNGRFAIAGAPPPTRQGHFFIAFDVVPYTLSDAEYTRVKADNVEINKRLTALYDGMHRINHKFDDFLPKDENEKKQVDAYNQLKSTLHVIPEYRYQHISLAYYDPFWMGHEFKSVVDAGQRKECQQVFKQVISLFAKYPGVD